MTDGICKGVEDADLVIRFPRKNEDVVLLERDLGQARRLLKDDFYSTGIPSECHGDVRNIVSGFVDRLERHRSRLVGIVGRRLVIECNAIVKKSVGTAVSTMFRQSGERPTLPNDYVKRLLEPLQFFLQSASVATLADPVTKASIKQHVAEGLCSAYKDALLDRLNFWEKSRMSLRRFNKGKSASTDPSSDSKHELGSIYHQHWLDINALGQILRDMDIEAVVPYRDLRDLIIEKKEDSAP